MATRSLSNRPDAARIQPAAAQRLPPKRVVATRRRVAVLVLFFVVLIAAMYRPTPSTVTSTLPQNLGDPALTTWIVAWETHALEHDPSQLFQGNMYYPHGDAILYSEMILPAVAVFAIPYALTGNAVLAHNVTIFALALLCLTCTFFLARRLIGRGDVAVFVAVAFSFSGFVFTHVGHLQLLTLGFFPLGFLALFVALERQRVRDGVALGIATFLIVTGCLYYGAIWMVCLAAIIAVELFGRRLRPGRRWWRAITVAALVAGVSLAPFALAYARFQHDVGFERPLTDAVGFDARDVITPAPGSLAYGWLEDWIGGKRPDLVEHGFFPGFAVIALSGVGVVVCVRGARRRRRATPPDRIGEPAPCHDATLENGRRRHELLLLLVAAGIALVLALGPSALGLPLPFRFFHEWVPAFNGMKAVSRFAVLPLLGGAILAGIGLDWLLRGRAATTRVLAVAVAILIVVAELSVSPSRANVDRSDEATSVYDALRHMPAGAVVELRVRAFGGGPVVPFVEGPRLLASIGDWRPRFNGFAGALPTGYFELAQVFNRFPAPDAVAALDREQVRYVVLHTSAKPDEWTYSDGDAARVVADLPAGAHAERIGAAWLITLPR